MDRASKQSCDNCRRRKIKCSRDLPCDKCQQLCLKCSYSDILCRKGPKFRTLYPLAPSHPLAPRQAPPSPIDTNTSDVQKEYTDFFSRPNLSSASCPVQYPYPLPQSISPLLASSTESGYAYQYPHANNSVPRPYARRLTSPILLAHVNVFIKYLFPIMPVVRREELKQDSHHPERVSPQRYAFLAALCAATHIQLKLDGESDQLPGGSSICSSSAATTASTIDIDGQALMSGEELLAEAVGARNECDVVEEMDIESLLTSLFLFACYGNLDKQKQAWFYLCQTTSMVFTLGLHRESTYAGLSIEEAEEKRRIFWLLFVTERGYALPQCKPIMLRASIQKPQVLCSDDPILSYGFLNLINLFEKITVNLYDWLAAGGAEADGNKPDVNSSVASSIQSSLCNSPIASLQGVLEIQQVDILVTQQWLQTMMWRISLGNSRRSSSGEGSDMLPFHLPIIVGKAVMGVISAASQGAVDAHGIGMEQKLFDLGTSVAKVAHTYASPPTPSRSHPSYTSTSPTTSPTAIPHPQDQQPQELLWSILTTLSRIRGSQSHLFPQLLEQCRPILGLDGTITLGNYLPVLDSDAADVTDAVTHTGPEFGSGPVRESQKEAIATPGHGGNWL